PRLADSVEREAIAVVPLALPENHVRLDVVRPLDARPIEHALGTWIDDVGDVRAMVRDEYLGAPFDVDVCVAALQEEFLERPLAGLVRVFGELISGMHGQLFGERQRRGSLDAR